VLEVAAARRQRRQRQRSGGSAAAAAAAAGQRSKDASGDALEGMAGGGGVAVLVELGRGVPPRVPRAVDVGRRAEGRESKGED
jgi:hypothetical protein